MTVQDSDEMKMILETVAHINAKYQLDYWRQKDDAKAFPTEYWAEICNAGLSGLTLPEEYGGAGMGMEALSIMVEALAAGGGGSTIAQLFMLNPVFGGISIARFGTDQMRAQWLPGLIDGSIQCCMALTEPNAGTNTPQIKTFAREVDDGWILNGQKIWISGVDSANKMLVVARTRTIEEVSRKTDGITLFMIDTDRDGLSWQKIDKVGTNTIASMTVFFDDVKIHADELIGTLHKGWPELLDVLNTERMMTTAGLVGASRLAITEAVRYANDRFVFGDRPISSYQGLQFPLAQAYAETMAARELNLTAAQLFDSGREYGSEANIAKLLAGQAAFRACDQAMQIMGGMGYSDEYHVERLWRDARLFRIAPVSEEMVLNFIAIHDLGMVKGY